VIGPIDVAGSIVEIEYVNCAGDPIIRPNELAGTFSVCGQSGSIPLIYKVPTGPIEDSSITVTTNCCISPSTTTTTTTPDPNNLIINNEQSGVTIDDISAGACSIATTVPIGPGGFDNGAIGNCTTDIGLLVSGVSPSDHCMTLIINGVVIQEIFFNTDGTYTFNLTPSILSTDQVDIVVRDGVCVSGRQGVVSAISDSVSACLLPMPIICWVTGNADIIDGLTVYTDPAMTIPFVGDGDFYHIQLDAYPNSYAIIIDGFGVTDGSGASIC
jgi:hypothetical protein